MNFVFSGLIILAAFTFVGCQRVGETKDISMTPEAKAPNIRVYCYDGVKYLAVWNNNPYQQPFLTGAKIDPKTLKPETCNE